MLEALRIYSKRDLNDPYPCRPFNLEEENTLVLSEGSGAFLLELVQPGKRYLSIIKGLGFAEEHNTSLTGVSNNGDAFYAAMAEASLNKLPDLVIPHAPGTKKGDKAELLAIRRLFGEKALIASLKHETGHTFGASGALGLSQGISYLHGKTIMDLPFQSKLLPIKNERVKSVIVNTAGFLGGAMSCQLTLP
jgi:3-oxoacyl-(acyl-carrier-protein) synthase